MLMEKEKLDLKKVKKKPRFQVRYPWDEWFTNKRFRLVKGKHYFSTTTGMVQTIRKAAMTRGLKVRLRIVDTDNWITVTVVEE